MQSSCNKRVRILFAGLGLFIYMAGATTFAQSPTPSPEDVETGYKITSSLELGARGLSVNGDYDKFRSDLNYRPGFRIFDSSLLIENFNAGSNLFDNALITSSGWGADPSGSFRLSLE